VLFTPNVSLELGQTPLRCRAQNRSCNPQRHQIGEERPPAAQRGFASDRSEKTHFDEQSHRPGSYESGDGEEAGRGEVVGENLVEPEWMHVSVQEYSNAAFEFCLYFPDASPHVRWL
jgi:hypothetical protein